MSGTISRHSLYSTWRGMIDRCRNEENSNYENYGGRGIDVFQRWVDDFWEFYDWMGDKPSDRHSLDRIDTNKGYRPFNVRWATPQEQSRNRRNTVTIRMFGREQSLSDWCLEYGIERSRIEEGVWAHPCIWNNLTLGEIFTKLGSRISEEEAYALAAQDEKNQGWDPDFDIGAFSTSIEDVEM